MNNDRRKQIEAARAKLQAALDLFEEAKGELESIRDDEQDYKDNMPESLQDSEKGEKADAAIDALDSAISDIEDISIDDINSYLDTAAE